MKRKRMVFRHIARVGDVYVDRTRVVVVGGRERNGPSHPSHIVKEVVHGTYECVERVTQEAIDGGFPVPTHDRVFFDPTDFTNHYLRRTS